MCLTGRCYCWQPSLIRPSPVWLTAALLPSITPSSSLPSLKIIPHLINCTVSARTPALCWQIDQSGEFQRWNSLQSAASEETLQLHDSLWRLYTLRPKHEGPSESVLAPRRLLSQRSNSEIIFIPLWASRNESPLVPVSSAPCVTPA